MSNNVTPEPGQKTAKSGSRRWPKVLIAVAAILVVLLTITTIVQERDTKPAKADIGEILELPGGDIQVREDGKGPPIVLIHGYSTSMHWWRRNVTSLSRSHRVVRIDLLGHGGSEKPRSGYSMENQARLVASVLKKKRISGVHVIGHSMGGLVATALAERHGDLVAKITLIDSHAEDSDVSVPFLGRLLFLPVIGHLLRTVDTRSLVKKRLSVAFAPGSSEDMPEQFVTDFLLPTYRSIARSPVELIEYLEAEPLPDRLAKTRKPVQVIMGSEDQIVQPQVLRKFGRRIPGASVHYVNNAGHNPQYEKPREFNKLILEFSKERK